MAPEAIPIILSPLIIVIIAAGLLYREIRRYKRYANEMVVSGRFEHDIDKVMAVLVLCRKWDSESSFLLSRLKEIQESKVLKKVMESKAPWRPEKKLLIKQNRKD